MRSKRNPLRWQVTTLAATPLALVTACSSSMSARVSSSLGGGASGSVRPADLAPDDKSPKAVRHRHRRGARMERVPRRCAAIREAMAIALAGRTAPESGFTGGEYLNR